MLKRRPTGFTLVELLVVISIIALLVSIMLPALGKVRKQANIIVCKSNVRQLLFACFMYGEDNDMYLPEPYYKGQHCGYSIVRWPKENDVDENAEKKAFSAIVNGGYLTEVDPFFCPADTLREDQLELWNDPDRRNIRCSYQYRGTLARRDSFSFRLTGGTLGNVAAGSPAALISDAFTPDWHTWILSHNSSGDIGGIRRWRNPPYPVGFNIGYVDGSVRWFDFEFGEKPWSGAIGTWTPHEVANRVGNPSYWRNVDGAY